MTTIGLVDPGEMGAAVGAQLRRVGHGVLWISADRSPETAAHAEASGLTDIGSPESLRTAAEDPLSAVIAALLH